MADVSRIFALGAQTQAQTLTWSDFEDNFSETTFMDKIMMPAMLKGRIILVCVDHVIEPSSDWDGTLDIARIRNVLNTAKSQVADVQVTLQTMITNQTEKCKQAGRLPTFVSFLEQTLQTDCDELMEKLHGLEDSYSAISDKWDSCTAR